MTHNESSGITVALLTVLLLLLIVALVYLYKRLNRETNGQYTVQQLVYGKGGALERLNDGVRAVESRLGVHLWPRKEVDTEGEQEELKEDERRPESDVEHGGEEEADGQEEKENHAEEDSSDDYSSMEGVDLREKAKQMEDKGDEMKEEEKEAEEKKEKDEMGQGSREASGGDGLLINLEPLSGSVIWEDEKKREGNTGDGDLTAL